MTMYYCAMLVRYVLNDAVSLCVVQWCVALRHGVLRW